MNRYLSPKDLEEVRRNISRSLADTFQMMFQLDIFLMPHFQRKDDSQTVCAYMELGHKEAKACLTIAITRMVIEMIVAQLKPDPSINIETVMQDIVCEITNIVGNHLRSYLADKTGIEFQIKLPQPGHPPAHMAETHALNLHFRIKENDSIDLDLSYAAPNAVAV